MEKAYEDLVWLSNRLSGILALADEVKTYADFKNQLTGMKDQTSAEKAEFVKTKERRDKMQAEMDQTAASFNLEQSKALEEVKLLLSDAKKQAKTIISEAKDKAESIVAAAEAQAQEFGSKLLHVQDLISSSEQKLQETEEKHSQVKADLEALKNKI